MLHDLGHHLPLRWLSGDSEGRLDCFSHLLPDHAPGMNEARELADLAAPLRSCHVFLLAWRQGVIVSTATVLGQACAAEGLTRTARKAKVFNL